MGLVVRNCSSRASLLTPAGFKDFGPRRFGLFLLASGPSHRSVHVQSCGESPKACRSRCRSCRNVIRRGRPCSQSFGGERSVPPVVLGFGARYPFSVGRVCSTEDTVDLAGSAAEDVQASGAAFGARDTTQPAPGHDIIGTSSCLDFFCGATGTEYAKRRKHSRQAAGGMKREDRDRRQLCHRFETKTCVPRLSGHLKI